MNQQNSIINSAKSWAKSFFRNALFFLVPLVAISLWQTRNMLPVDEPAPMFSGSTLDGQIISLESFAGKSVLVYFFAPWCGVCRLSANNIVQIQKALGKENIQVVAVALDFTSDSEVERFVKDADIGEVPVILGDEKTRDLYQIQAYPTYYGMDKNGRVRFRNVGYSFYFGLLFRAYFYI